MSSAVDSIERAKLPRALTGLGEWTFQTHSGVLAPAWRSARTTACRVSRSSHRRIGVTTSALVARLSRLPSLMAFQCRPSGAITFHSPSRLIGEHEAQLKEYIARRDTLREILGEE